MSRATERALVMGHFTATWNAAYASVPIAWPNHEFLTPTNQPFAVFNLVDRGTTRESLGRTYFKRHRGTIQVDLYMPLGQGIKWGYAVSDYLETVYDSLDLVTTDNQPVRFRTPTARPIAGNEARASNLEDNWARLVVEIPFDRSEVLVR